MQKLQIEDGWKVASPSRQMRWMNRPLWHKHELRPASQVTSVGLNRLKIELEDRAVTRKIMAEYEKEGNEFESPTLASMQSKWSDLVDSIANILVTELGIAPNSRGHFGKRMQKRFITEIWGLMSGHLHIVYGRNKHEMLWESLLTNEFDCDNSAFLVFDVASRVGIPCEILNVRGRWIDTDGTLATFDHASFRTDDFFFETASGGYQSIKKLPIYYPHIYGRIAQSNAQDADMVSYVTRGSAKIKFGDYEGAKQDFLLAKAVSPNDPMICCHMGIAKAKLGDYRGAIEEYETTIRIAPDYRYAYYGMANAKAKLGDHQGAIEYYDIAARAYPKDAEVCNDRGISKRELGDTDGARADFEKALIFDPKFEEARKNLEEMRKRPGPPQ